MKRKNYIKWNTGRQYTTSGQLMIACEDNGDILFMDYTRHITGVIKGITLNQNDVMAAYDSGNYTSCTLNQEHFLRGFTNL
jgi:hypothetical protein